jgi:AcrR family transcriptional regulator
MNAAKKKTGRPGGGSRERAKAERRRRILDAAARLFEQDGFGPTTMEAIAEKAGVGVATVYNYFRTKAGIAAELVTPDLERAWAMNEAIIADPPADPAEAILAMVRNFQKPFDNWRFRRLLRAITLPAGVEAPAALQQLVDWSDRLTEQQFRDMLRALQLRGRIPKDADVRRMATIIFAAFNHEYMLYLTHEDLPARRVFSEIEELIRVLFRPWTT